MTLPTYVADIDFQQSVQSKTLSQLTKKSQLRDCGLTTVAISKVIVGYIHGAAEGLLEPAHRQRKRNTRARAS
jgi:hypothetical protein